MAKKTRTELSTLAINTNLPDNTQELITPTTERSQLTDERESVVNYKDDLGGAPNAGKFLTVAVDGESLTMVDAPTGDVTGTGEAFKIAFWFDTKVITFDTALFFNTNNNRLTAAQFEATLKVISAAYESAVGSSMTFATGETGDPSPTTRLTISSGGNVGIGTTSPNSYFVRGGGLVVDSVDAGSNVVILNDNNTFSSLFFAKGSSGAEKYQGYIEYEHSNNAMAFGTNQQERLRISSGGVVSIPNGIVFNNNTTGGTPNATNVTLNDYEEGTFTPTIDDNAGHGVTYSHREGEYTRVGNVVYYRVTVLISAIDSGMVSGNNVFVKGYPYASGSVSGGLYQPASTLVRNCNFSGYVSNHVVATQSYGFLFDSISGSAGSELTWSAISSNFNFQAIGFYHI